MSQNEALHELDSNTPLREKRSASTAQSKAESEGRTLNELGEQSQQERKELRDRYRHLMTLVTHEGEEALLRDRQKVTDDEGLKDAIDKADALFSSVKHAEEAVLDAQVCKQISRMCRQRAEGFSTNVQGFHPQEYADKLIAIMNGSRDENGVAIIPQPNWVQLGQATKTLFARGPSLHYINGALAETKVEKKGQAVKQKRVVQKDHIVQVTKSTELRETEKSDNLTEAMVQAAFGSLVTHFKANGKRPINYFEFVIDPESFGATVENVFHTSFLVKENRVRFSIQNRTPYIEPVKRKTLEASQVVDEEKTRNQAVLVLSKAQWRQLKEHLKITNAMIPRRGLTAHSKPNKSMRTE